jgi:hypothetical protein
MLQDKHESFCWAKRAGVTAFVLMLGVLIFGGYAASLASGAPNNKDKNQEFTRVYEHTYDEVFQAAQETIERMGLFVTDKDKDKGTISGKGDFAVQQWTKKCTFDIYIETLNTKPETRVTIKPKIALGYAHDLTTKFFGELQKVLSTYH